MASAQAYRGDLLRSWLGLRSARRTCAYWEVYHDELLPFSSLVFGRFQGPPEGPPTR